MICLLLLLTSTGGHSDQVYRVSVGCTVRESSRLGANGMSLGCRGPSASVSEERVAVFEIQPLGEEQQLSRSY